MTDLCETFRRQAGAVWNRMEKAATLGMPLNEETITEITSFEIAYAHQASPDYAVRIATKPEEVLHGADWEWWLVKDGVGVGYRVQAKRLFVNGQYQSLFKSPPDRLSQAKMLVRKADLDGMVPLYCFYNPPRPATSFYLPTRDCLHSYRGSSRWGCALMDANHLLAWPSNKFKDLCQFSRPWHELVCVGNSGDTLPAAGARFANYLRSHPGPDGRRLDLAPVEPRRIPPHVAQMLDSEMRAREQPGVLTDLEEQVAHGAGTKWIPEGLAGIVVFEDIRNEDE